MNRMDDLNDIRLIGRTYFDVREQSVLFFFTASGFEVAFIGSTIKALFRSTNSKQPDKRAYVVALIDEDDNPLETDDKTFVLDGQETQIVITGLENKYHRIKFLKRNEASDSVIALKRIETDGKIVKAPDANDFKIQFIAASSSTGYGNLGNLHTPKTTGNSDGLKGFAFLTAYMLGAECEIFAASGWGATRGWNTGGNISATQNIPAAYEYYAIDEHNKVFTTAGLWNHQKDIPDVIVMNLGTNDFNSCGYGEMSMEEKKDADDLFIRQYSLFIERLHNLYPQAPIIVAYGLMGDKKIVEKPTLEAIERVNRQIEKNIIFPFVMEAAGSGGNPYGSDYHPNVITHANVARKLAARICLLTGREIVHDI